MPYMAASFAALTLQERFIRNFLESNRWQLLLNGLLVTLNVSFFAVLIGVVLGVFLALMRLSRSRLLSAIAGIYIDVIRGTPVVVQLMIFYFVLLGPIKWIDKTWIAAIAFGFNSGAYVADRPGGHPFDRSRSNRSGAVSGAYRGDDDALYRFTAGL